MVVSMVFAWTSPGGKLLDNFETLGAVTQKKFTVPTGKRWLLFGGYCERDADAKLWVRAFNSADKLLSIIAFYAAGGSDVTFGCGYLSATLNQPMAFPLPLKAGDYIAYDWSVAQTTPEVTLIVLEVDA